MTTAKRPVKDVTTRHAGACDREALARIMPLAFEPGTMHHRVWGDLEHIGRSLLAQATRRAQVMGSMMIVAEVDDQVAGGMFAHLAFNEGRGAPHIWRQIGIIDTLAVDAGLRRRGAGWALLERAERHLARAGASFFMLECPESARPFYEACGYTVEDRDVSVVACFPPPDRPYSFGRGDDEDGLMAWKATPRLGGPLTIGEYPRDHPDGSTSGRLVLGLWPGDLERAMGEQAAQARRLGFG